MLKYMLHRVNLLKNLEKTGGKWTINVTLQVNGREITFSKEEITAIVEKHLATGLTKKGSEVQPPVEGEWFEVNIQTINKKLFKDERADRDQEETRQLILEALSEAKNNPQRYGKKFKTMMPKKMWNVKTVAQLKQLACELGDHNADWVEQALEWAQRICNGESWEAICNNIDTANWYRLVIWKNRYATLVGGSHVFNYDYLASSVSKQKYYSMNAFNCAVPLVVHY